MNDLVDIIMPVYNMEKYLNRSIQSVLAQTYHNFRLLAVDDGSKDKSLDILREYQNQDSRIKIYTQSNQGVSCARNVGLDHVQGRYICFLDPDDYLEINYIMDLINDIKKNKSDISICYFSRFFENGEEKFPTNLEEEVQKKEEFLKDFFLENNKGGGYIWNKLFSRKVINNIRFSSDIHVGEDVKFLFNVVLNSERISTIPKVGYHYYMRSDSASRTPTVDQVFLESMICKEMYQKVLNNHYEDLGLYALKRYVRQTASYLVIASTLEPEKMKVIQKEIKPYFWQIVKIKDVSVIRKIVIFIKIYMPNIARKTKMFNGTYTKKG